MSTQIAALPLLPELLTPLPGPKATAIIERDQAVLSPSYTRCYPLVIKRGEGAIVEDVDGNRFLDFNAGIAVVATGHAHPRVVHAIQQQAAQFLHMSGTDFYYESMVQLAEKLAALAPGGLPRRVYFGNSGTEAVEAAIKLARYHSGRDKFIAFFGSFHGRTMGALSLTASKVTQRRGFGPMLPVAAHSLCQLLSLSLREDSRGLRCRMRKGDRGPALQNYPARRRSRRHRRRACAGRRRLSGPARQISRGTAKNRRQIRHPADSRRGAVRHGPHRTHVRFRALRRLARYRHDRQRNCQRHALVRHHRARGGHGLEAGRTRLNLRRQSRLYRRRPYDD